MSLLWVKVVGVKKIFNTEDTGDTEEYQGLPPIVTVFGLECERVLGGTSLLQFLERSG